MCRVIAQYGLAYTAATRAATTAEQRRANVADTNNASNSSNEVSKARDLRHAHPTAEQPKR